jgi:2-polyprenyl-3-methyl-5-hydroxy-6-metoxy-1,4-benzoquinol methylase
MNPEEYARMHQFEDWYWWFVARREAALRFARDFWPRDRPARVLDAGCGTGALMSRLSKEGSSARIYGMDLAWDALAFSRGRGQRGLVQADLTALPFDTDSFDIVTALDVVEHVEEDRAALAEICRVLRPGGALVMSVPAYPFLWSSHDAALHHKRRYTAGMLAPRIQAAGLTVAKMTYLLAFLFPVVALFRLADRLRPGKRPARAHLVPVPAVVNRLLIGLQSAELSLARRLALPFGVTLFCVARKPAIIQQPSAVRESAAAVGLLADR